MRAGPDEADGHTRTRLPWMISLGIAAGGLLLAVLSGTLASVIWIDDAWSQRVIVGMTAFFLVGDVWAIRYRRLFPLARHRQAKQGLVLRWRRMSRVQFVWGVDAGLGIGTYRVTSGLWLLIAGTLLGAAPPVTLLVSSVTFGIGVLIASSWYSRRDSIVKPLLQLASLRRYAQVLYVLVALAWVVVIVRTDVTS